MNDEWASAPIAGSVFDPVETKQGMDPTIKARWVEALTSGTYEQGHYVLRTDDDCYCVIGVLVDLAIQDDVVEWDKTESGEWICRGSINYLPQVVMEWAGIHGAHQAEAVVLEWGGVNHPIWRMNDTYQVPFDVLAYLIEAQL